AVGEAEQIVAEQQGAARDSTRRPPSSLGFEIVVVPDADSRLIELTLDVRFCVYTQYFPTFEEQREELGQQATNIGEEIHNDTGLPGDTQPLLNTGQPAVTPTPVGARARGSVSLLETFVRHLVRVPLITIRIQPIAGRQRLTDNGRIQQTLDAVLDEAAT